PAATVDRRAADLPTHCSTTAKTPAAPMPPAPKPRDTPTRDSASCGLGPAAAWLRRDLFATVEWSAKSAESSLNPRSSSDRPHPASRAYRLTSNATREADPTRAAFPDHGQAWLQLQFDPAA